jgi:hypothetical protein
VEGRDRNAEQIYLQERSWKRTNICVANEHRKRGSTKCGAFEMTTFEEQSGRSVNEVNRTSLEQECFVICMKF